MLAIDPNIFPIQKGVYIVGGSIRDLFRGRSPLDYDLAVLEQPELFARGLAARTSGRVVEFGRGRQKIQRVVAADRIFDIMPVQGASIEEDLRRRDFTVNAMALEVSSADLIDPLGGRQDLAAKKIRMVSEDVFRKDPLRLIRAFRLAAAFDFTITTETAAAICRNAHLIVRSAGERIREEFFKILQLDKSYGHLCRMADTGILPAIFPELLELKNVQATGGRHRDLLAQTLKAYDHLEDLLTPGNPLVPTIANLTREDLNPARSALLKCALLFHAIGKPAARTIAADGALHFYGYFRRSAALAANIARRLRFSRRQTDTLDIIIRHHTRPFWLFRARQKKTIANKAFVRLFLSCGETTPAVLLHALAQHWGGQDRPEIKNEEFSGFILTAIQNYYTVLRPRSALPPPLNGDDLIQRFDLSPSPILKRILAHVNEERLSRNTLTRSQAFKLVEAFLSRRNLGGHRTGTSFK